ncbi:MAG: exodeoxyribonuclease VII large subunit [Limnohabitans sp.]|nr:exodeoxyribonuclease VII large subunit [Limnohabitans sp.]
MPRFNTVTEASSNRVWSVGGLCHAISDQLKARFGLVMVQGEISGMMCAGSGHCYLTLKDEQGQLRCAMFRRVAESLAFEPRNGDLVQVQARVGLYEPRGEMQLVIESMRPAGTGQLHEAFLKLKARLEAQGLFDADRKRPIPPRPRCIGVVTSLSAAALHDVLTALHRRVPHIPVRIAPAAVQGTDAPAGLIAALAAVQQLPQVDVILLVRGGGSMEDLWAFNDEALALAIVSSRVPVVVGVGHETDVTIADYCADLRAPTPTAAAELCAIEQSADLADLDDWQAALMANMHARIEQSWQRLDRAERQLGRPSALLHAQQLACGSLASRLERGVFNSLKRRQLVLLPMALRLLQAASNLPRQMAHRLDKSAWLLRSLDPSLVLKRGYAWLQNKQGVALVSVKEFDSGQQVIARLSDGQIGLTVNTTGDT